MWAASAPVLFSLALFRGRASRPEMWGLLASFLAAMSVADLKANITGVTASAVAYSGAILNTLLVVISRFDPGRLLQVGWDYHVRREWVESVRDGHAEGEEVESEPAPLNQRQRSDLHLLWLTMGLWGLTSLALAFIYAY